MIAIDFFCGAGGLTRGLLNAGTRVLGGIDICAECRQTYEQNNDCKFVEADIRSIDKTRLLQQFPEIGEDSRSLLLAGCAPCQPFSSQRREKTEHADFSLLMEFARIVSEILPAYVLVENVPGLKHKGKQVFDSFIDVLQKHEYYYSYKIVNARDYGVPQNRNRLLIVASRLFQPSIPDGQYGKEGLAYKTVRDVISHYPPIVAGESSHVFPNHSASSLTEINLERIKATPHSGGDRRSWPSNLVLECHSNGHSGHTDVYGRMSWDNVAPTLTGRCYSLSNGRYGHPEQDRAISLREAAALQSFDDSYVFYGNTMSIGKQIGNAVPVKLAETIGSYLISKARNANISED